MSNQCAHCSKNAKVELKYLGKWLCEACFCRLIERRISRTIRKNRLIQKGDKIAVAFSGGQDSSLMLHYLAGYAKQRRIDIFALYVDREDTYSKNSLLFTEAKAKKLGIPFHCFSFKKELGVSFEDIRKISQKAGTNLCSVCGVMRRYILNRAARKLGASKLAIGHNLTDEAQSCLMNFAKGELKNFLNINPASPTVKGFIPRIKILRDVPKDEIHIYNRIKKIEFFPEPCPCRVGSLRYKFVTILDALKLIRPSAEFALCTMGDEVAEFAREKYKGKKMGICKKCGELAAKDICRVCQYLSAKD